MSALAMLLAPGSQVRREGVKVLVQEVQLQRHLSANGFEAGEHSLNSCLAVVRALVLAEEVVDHVGIGAPGLQLGASLAPFLKITLEAFVFDQGLDFRSD